MHFWSRKPADGAPENQPGHKSEGERAFHYMTRSRLFHMTCAVATALALALATAACGDSESSSTSEGASTAAATGKAPSAPDVEYDGPETKLPAKYDEPTMKDGFQFTLGWLEPTAANPFVKAISTAAKKETERLGGRFIELDAGLNVDKQVSQCNQLVAQKVDAMGVYPVDPASLSPCLKDAEAAGIKIVGQDTPPIAGEPLLPHYLSVVLQGTDHARFLMAEYAASQQPGVKFATIGVNIPVPLLHYSIDRAKYWGEQFGMQHLGQVDSQGDTSEDSATAMSTLLTRFPDVKAVFTFNDPAAEAAATTARAAGRTDVKVYGNSGEKAAVEMVKAGQMAGTVLLDTNAIGSQMVRGLYNALTDQGLPLPKQITPVPQVVTPKNAGSVTPIGG
jgi:ribose transport system substrate-binding protein